MRIFEILETSYSNFTETMTNFLNKTFGGLGQAYSTSSIFGALLEGIKGVMQNMMFYIEDAMTEQNIFTAVRKKSIYSLAKISGYEPFYGSAATGTVLVSNKISNSSAKVVLMDETILTNNSNGIRYSLDLPTDSLVIDMSKPLVVHEVKVIQGLWNRASATAKGEALETIEANLNGLYDSEYLRVYVNGEQYSIASCLYDMIENEHACVVKNGYEGGFSVMFGNGYHGKCLNNGDQIIVKYIVHDGSTGNISPSSNVEIEFSSTVYDVLGNAVNANDLLQITINNYICGGSDADTISSVRELVGMNSRSLVIAGEDNFRMFLKRFSFLGQFNLLTSKNSLNITCIPFAKFKEKISSTSDYLKLEANDLLLTDSQKEMIKNSLDNSNKTFTGVTISFIDPIIRKYSVTCYIKLNTISTKETIRVKVSEAISTYFMNLSDNVTFISKSDLISYVVNNVQGMNSFDLDFVSEADEIARKKGYWYKKELTYISGQLTYSDIRTIYDKTDMIGLDEIGNIRLRTNLEMPLIHRCTMTYDDYTQQQVDPIQFFFI